MTRTRFDTLFGLLELARLAARTRFRIRGAYWRWREETAFGYPDRPVSRREKWRMMIEYGCWVRKMRKGLRGS